MKNKLDKIHQVGSVLPDVDCEPKTTSHECRNNVISDNQDTAKNGEINKNTEL